MATKKKIKPDPKLTMVAAIVPIHLSDALKVAANRQNRSVSKAVKKLIEECPDVQAALKEIQAA